MKKIKVIILIAFIFMLTGCSWESVQKKYGDTLNKKPSCTYYTQQGSAKADFFEISSMTFSADYNGVYFSVNSGAKKTLWDNNNQNLRAKGPNTYLLFSEGFLKKFFESYQQNNSCPSRVYIERTTSSFQMESCESTGTVCDGYTLKQSTIKNEKGENVDCHQSGASYCVKTSIDISKTPYYIELGYFNNKKYIGVATDENYTDIVVATDGTLGVTKNMVSFVVPSQNAINEIWLTNGKVISKDKLVIKRAIGSVEQIYYITGSEKTNPGESEKVETKDVTNEDTNKYDTVKNEKVHKDLDITAVNLCSATDANGNANHSLLVFQVIGYIILIIKILVPIVLIVLGSIDLGKATLSNDDKAIKDSSVQFGKRILIGLVIFFIPTILDFFLSLINGVNETTSKFEGCTNCILNPNNSSKCSPKKLID